MHALAFQDLFSAGSGFDVAGAYLLGRGLLASVRDIVRRSTSFWNYSPVEAAVQAADRVDALFGLAALLLGFTLQALAYALALSGFSSSGTRFDRALVSGGLAIGATGIAVGLWLIMRKRLIRTLLVKIASFDPGSESISGPPWGRQLVLLGQELGHLLRVSESEADYARRVFGVSEIRPGDPRGVSGR